MRTLVFQTAYKRAFCAALRTVTRMVKELVEQSSALRHNGVIVRELTDLYIDRSTLWNNSVKINVLSKLKVLQVRGAL